MSRTSVPPVMMRPSLLPEGHPWELRCPCCVLLTQGGIAGLLAHVELIHPEQGLAEVRRLCTPQPENEGTTVRHLCQPPTGEDQS